MTNLSKAQTLQARLTELGYKLDRVRLEAEDMKRLITVYGEKGITNNALERLDTALLNLSAVRDEIREVFND